MDRHPDSKIIDDLGGTTAVAALCQCKPPSVSEWRRTGIPLARRLYLNAVKPEVVPAPPKAPDAAGTLKDADRAA